VNFSKKKSKIIFLHFFLSAFFFEKDILITEMGVSSEAKNVIPLKFLRKIKNNFFLLL
jgi:hypothetical protein